MTTSPKLHQTYYDIDKFVIWGNPVNEGERKPRLTFGFRDGNPRITVHTGGEGNESMITFPCDVPHFAAILIRIEELANLRVIADDKFFVESLTNDYKDNQPTGGKKVVSTLAVGKTKEGVIYLAVLAESRPTLIFPIKPSEFHTFKDKDKMVIDDHETSRFLTLGITRVLLSAISHYLVQYSNERYDAGSKKPTPIKKNTTQSKAATQPDFDALDEISY